MKIAIGVALFLFCVAGLMIVSKRQKSATIEASAPQEVRIVNDLNAVQIENLNVSNPNGAAPFATFNVVNASSEPLTALVLHCGKYQIMTDPARFGNAIEPGQKVSLTLTIDGAQPLTVDAVLYKSGKAEGNPSAIRRVEDTRKGYRAAIQMIVQEMKVRSSLSDLRAALSNLPIKKDGFTSSSAFFGATDAKQDVLSKLAEIESLTDQAKIDSRMRDLNMWVTARLK
ncbi:MAG TPA: hypothetical protein VJ810_36985 [Blastocatellia bacterium]|nr:hypothetical protein [Blastocatellia bacterium]